MSSLGVKKLLHPKKISILLPVAYQGGTFRLAKNLAKTVQTEAERRGENISVIFGNTNGEYKEKEDLEDLLDLGVSVRKFQMKTISKRRALALTKEIPGSFVFRGTEFTIPHDNQDEIFNSDLWFFVSDRIFRPLIPFKKTAIFAADYIQRYVPQIFDDRQFSDLDSSNHMFIRNARNADYVFVSSPGTYQDVKGYVGKREGVVFLEPAFDSDFLRKDIHPIPSEAFAGKPYFVWVTNGTYHKNHFRALDALLEYYKSLGGRLRCFVTGVNTHTFNPVRNLDKASELDHSYHKEIRRIISEAPELKQNLCFPGNVSDQEYFEIVRRARFLWHNVIADNGTFSVIEAAYMGVPALSSDYPQQRYINEHFGLDMEFFDPFDPSDAARKLVLMEKNDREMRVDNDLLAKKRWQGLAPVHYNIIRACLDQPRMYRNYYL